MEFAATGWSEQGGLVTAEFTERAHGYRGQDLGSAAGAGKTALGRGRTLITSRGNRHGREAGAGVRTE